MSIFRRKYPHRMVSVLEVFLYLKPIAYSIRSVWSREMQVQQQG